MYNHEIRARDRKLLIVLEYGELDCAKFLRKNKGNISQGFKFFVIFKNLVIFEISRFCNHSRLSASIF